MTPETVRLTPEMNDAIVAGSVALNMVPTLGDKVMVMIVLLVNRAGRFQSEGHSRHYDR